MSYAITAYFTDENIIKTSITSSWFSYTGYYGDSYYYTDEIDFSMNFYATPADGCEFTRWVYRLGSTSGDVQYSYDNPFTYSGDENIYIRAEGEQSITSWIRYTRALGTVSSLKSVNISLGKYEIYRFSVSFSESGTAHFYTENSEADVCGYFSTLGGWNSESGEPSEPLVYNDDGNGMPNFRISYEVEAGETYYVWVRCLSPDSSGSVTLYVEPPGETQEDPVWTVSSYTIGTISENITRSFSISSYTLRRYKVIFANSGTAKFYTTGSTDTYGYLSTTTDFDSSSGALDDYLERNDDGDDRNFSITYDVTAGRTYYIWVRGYSESTSGTTVLNIEVPATASRPSDFSWTYEKVKGETFNLTADEWNNFTSRINAFRKYKVLDDHDFTWAYSGNDFMAYMYNEARIAIQEIDGYGTYIPTVYSGWQISAHMMNVLVSELNSIP